MKARVNVEYTLNNGQAFRWHRRADGWRGVCGDKIIMIYQENNGISFEGTSSKFINEYMRLNDDLDIIYDSICQDKDVAAAVDQFQDMRLLKQDLWECSASYMLATNATVPRIKSMIESVCRKCGDELDDNLFSFPTPEQIASADIFDCGLGFRAERLKNYAKSVSNGTFDLEELKKMTYENAIERLMSVCGIGFKVADCVALFSLGHLEACPIDARIAHAMEDVYGVKGSYAKVSSYARAHFGPYAGYAQEYFYIRMSPEYRNHSSTLGHSGHTQGGAFNPV